MLRDYLPAIVFLILGSLVGLLFATLNLMVGRRAPNRSKVEPYECGLPSDVQRGFRFGISFYLVAMLFILFDIEVIFLYPIAVQLRAFGTFAMIETVVFVVLLLDRVRVRLAPGSARVEIKREPLSNLRVRQHQARDLLRGDMDDEELERYVEERVLTTTVERAVGWAQGNSIYPLTFGLACCAIEMMSIVGARLDIARFGFEAFRASPRQADLIILSGRVSIKMAPVIRRIWDQMLEPKWAISMGACCSSMGVFNNYALVPSDKFMPISVHVPGCPPRPEALMHGILRLRDRIQGHGPEGWRERYAAVGTEELLPDEANLSTADVNVFKPGDTAGA